jgi:hypothetical protein
MKKAEGGPPQPELFAVACALRLLQGSRWKGLLAKLRIYYNLHYRARDSIKYRELQEISLLSRGRFQSLLKNMIASGRLEKSEQAYYNITKDGVREYGALISSLMPMMDYICVKYHLAPQKKFAVELMIPETATLISYVKKNYKPTFETVDDALASIEDYLKAASRGDMP